MGDDGEPKYEMDPAKHETGVREDFLAEIKEAISNGMAVEPPPCALPPASPQPHSHRTALPRCNEQRPVSSSHPRKPRRSRRHLDLVLLWAAALAERRGVCPDGGSQAHQRRGL